MDVPQDRAATTAAWEPCTQALDRAHRVFAELVPGGAPTKKSVTRYQTLLAGIGPGRAARRDVRLTDRRTALRETAAELRADDLDTLCDTLLHRLAPHPTDDVCLLAVHLPHHTP